MTSVMMIAFLLVGVSDFMVCVIVLSRMLVNMIICMGVMGCRLFSLAIQDEDLCRGDAAAIYLIDLERCPNVQGRNRIVKNLW